MNNNDSFEFNGDGSMLLSYELLYLLQWLMDHEADSLQKLIAKAVSKGYRPATLATNDFVEVQLNDTMLHQSIVEFLGLMDSMLLDLEQEQSIQRVLDRITIPALKQIDSKVCDEAIVQTSLEKTSNRLKSHPNENPREVLLKELLRRWKPAKKSNMN